MTEELIDLVFHKTPVDSGCIMLADPSHYKDWEGKYGPTHEVSVPNGDYIAEWFMPVSWLEENANPTKQPLKITTGKLWVSDPCYIVNDFKWRRYLETYGYAFEKVPRGVIAINTGGDGKFTVIVQLWKQ